MGRPSFSEQGPHFYFPKQFLYLKLCIEDNGGGGQSHARSAVLDPYQSQAFFLQTYHMQKLQVIYIIFWPGGLLTFYDPFFRKLIFSKGDYFKVRHHPPKALDKVIFLQGKSVVGCNKKRINSRVRGYKLLKLLLTFLYTNYINQYTPRDTVGKGYGNLAASISSTKKSSTSFCSNNFNSLRCSALLKYLKLPVPLLVWRL